MTIRRAYPLPEVAQQLGVSEKTLRREIKDGKLAARRIRGVLVVFGSEIVRYLEALPEEPHAQQEPIRAIKAAPSGGRTRVVRRIDIAADLEA